MIKKSRKKPETPNCKIKSALRMLFLRSRERAACLKLNGNKCKICGKKASVAKGREVKIEVHHRDGVSSWQRMYEVIREELLCSPEKMECLCKECHHDLHESEEEITKGE